MSRFNIGINVDPANNPLDLLNGLKYTSALQFDDTGNGYIAGDLSVNTLNYQNLNPGIPAGAQGATGAQGLQGATGAEGNNFAYSTISFFLLIDDVYAIGSPAAMFSTELPVTPNSGVFGWPLLPHGGGSSYNNYAFYMGSSPGNFPARGVNYGEYMPQDGVIVGAAVNWATTNITGSGYTIYAVNYGPNIAPVLPFGINITSSSLGGQIPNGGVGNWRGSNSVWDDSQTFSAGDYIGIYITDDRISTPGRQLKDPIEIEGTIYFRFKNENVPSNNSEESTWP